jgi:hypothetical protein
VPNDLARARYVDAGRLGTVQALRLQHAAAWLGRRRRMRTRIDLVEVWISTRPRSVTVEHRRDAGKSFPTASESRSGGERA